jgi:uncharacterized membrane protein YphA (DoxX/SURF4 family)
LRDYEGVMTAPGSLAGRARALARTTRDAPTSRDVALLAARVGLAWIFVYHGAGTLFGAFGGSGIHAQAVYFAHVAHLRPGPFFAVLGGIIECFGGAAVGLGILGSGYELNVALAALALVVAIMGTGRLSLDALLRRLITREAPADPRQSA